MLLNVNKAEIWFEENGSNIQDILIDLLTDEW
jgi:hypothetical protein